jgi:hypothetical protein
VPESPAFSQARQRAEALAESGDLDGARALLERAVEIARSQLAQGDADLLATMRQLADVHMRADDPMAARRTLEEALEAGIRLGDADPLVLMLSYDLGLVAEELANRHVARTNFTRVAEFGPSVLGAAHPAVVHARSYLDPTLSASLPAASPPAAFLPDVSSPVDPAATASSPGISAPIAALPVAGVPAVGPVPTVVPPVAATLPDRVSPISASSPSPAAQAASPFAAGPAPAPPAAGSRSRKSWVLAGVAVVAVTVAVTAIFVRTGDEAASSVQAAPASVTLHDAGSSVMVLWSRPANTSVAAFAITGGPAGSAAEPLGETTGDVTAFEVKDLDPAVDYCFAVVASYGSDGAATSPQACTARASAASSAGSSAPASAATPTGSVAAATTPTGSAAASPRTPEATPTRAATPTKAAAVKTAIVAPANNSTVAWPFDAEFAVSAADASATGTVLSVSICVAGRCYLDGKVDIYDGVAAPYTVYLGSTKPEGTGVAWQLRLDRISKATYGRLVAERDASIAAGTWGNDSTRMNALNATPVSSLKVTKAG